MIKEQETPAATPVARAAASGPEGPSFPKVDTPPKAVSPVSGTSSPRFSTAETPPKVPKANSDASDSPRFGASSPESPASPATPDGGVEVGLSTRISSLEQTFLGRVGRSGLKPRIKRLEQVLGVAAVNESSGVRA